MTREELINSDEYIDETVNCFISSNRTTVYMRNHMKNFIKGLRNELIAENAALRQQVKDMGEVIKELKQKV